MLASILVAPVFALFHLPAFFVSGWIMDEGYSLSQFPAALAQVGVLAVFAVFFRVLIMWLYNRTGRSVLLVGLFHSSFNMVSGQQMMPELVPGLNTNLLVVAIVAVLAVVLAVSTRGAIANAAGLPCARTQARRSGTTDR